MAMSPRAFDTEWCAPIELSGVWYSGPAADPVGFITSTTREGAWRQRERIRACLEPRARRLIWC